MQKAIWLCNGDLIDEVYPKWLKDEMDGIIDMHPIVIKRDDFDENIQLLENAQIVFSTWGMISLNEEEIERYLPNVKCVFYGAGSVQAFARPFLNKGIRVFSAWIANGIPVVEYCIAIISLALKGYFKFKDTVNENWQASRDLVQQHPGSYKTVVGVLGAGTIGSGVLRKLQDSDIEVLVYDPFLSFERAEEMGAEKVNTLDEIFTRSMLISNHIANLEVTLGILKYEHFMAMPKNGVFLNSGRNSQVDVDGLVRAAKQRADLQIITDVTDPNEPPTKEHPYQGLSNITMTPHMAGSTGKEIARMGGYMVEEYNRYINDENPKWEVTIKILDTMA